LDAGHNDGIAKICTSLGFFDIGHKPNGTDDFFLRLVDKFVAMRQN
jgi:hypothetical protein